MIAEILLRACQNRERSGIPSGAARLGGGSDRVIFHLRFDIFHLVIHEHKLVMVRADKLANEKSQMISVK